ncbi:hypothetical protein C8Q76DRAFT_160856 [Earliella scabrosa]|nr:hypothetical protein C8Q76DRAFT_160856 [Earliella scabrosa]
MEEATYGRSVWAPTSSSYSIRTPKSLLRRRFAPVGASSRKRTLSIDVRPEVTHFLDAVILSFIMCESLRQKADGGDGGGDGGRHGAGDGPGG